MSPLKPSKKNLEKEIIRAVIVAEEKERERLSKELHDELGPLLSTIKLYVNELLSDDPDPKVKEEISQYALELIDDAINTTRNISNNLMPRVLSDYGLIKGVDSFCKRVSAGSKVKIAFDHGNYEKHEQTIELIIYRVINELINNTIKHAQAKKILIILNQTDKHISINYFDDGIGFELDQILNDPKTGMGLRNIFSRIKSVDGTFTFTSRKGQGISINIKLKHSI